MRVGEARAIPARIPVVRHYNTLMMDRVPVVNTLGVVDWFLNGNELPVSPEHPCPYLPGLTARSQAFHVDELDPEIHAALMDRGFRRSGRLLYRPVCDGCRACEQLRVPVNTFRPSRSQRRVWRRNRDIRAEIVRPVPTETKWRLYSRYLAFQHDDTMTDDWDDMVNFLYVSPVDTIEIDYYLGESLVGVSFADRSAETLSSVYMCFDPQHAGRSLGTFSVLWEIDYCRRQGMPFYYLGFYVAGARTMAYKSKFGPNEVLNERFEWVRRTPDQPMEQRISSGR